jgi:hypothetical protein
MSLNATRLSLGWRAAHVRLTATAVAQACAASGALLVLLLMQLRVSHLAPLWTVAAPFGLFHVGFVAALVGLSHRPRSNALGPLVANGLAVALFWLGTLSAVAFAAQFRA